MTYFTFSAAAVMAFFLLIPAIAPAQTAAYTHVKAKNTAMNTRQEQTTSAAGLSFQNFQQYHARKALVLDKNYTALADFSFMESGPLLHTFFKANGIETHVIFGKANTRLLEVITYPASAHPAHLVQQVADQKPDAHIVVVKKITSRYDTWYEILLRTHDTLEKIELSAD